MVIIIELKNKVSQPPQLIRVSDYLVRCGIQYYSIHNLSAVCKHFQQLNDVNKHTNI